MHVNELSYILVGNTSCPRDKNKTKQRRKVWKDQGWKKHDDQELFK